MKSRRRGLVSVAVGAAVALALVVGSTAPGIVSRSISVVSAADGLTPQPIAMPGFPTPAATIDGWVASDDQAAIRAHAWALWAGITAITPQSQGWPIWETWYTDTEVQAGPPSPGHRLAAIRAAGRPVHVFIRPRQFRHRTAGRFFASPLAAAGAVGEQVVGFNKFDLEYAQFVWTNAYQQVGTPTRPGPLWSLQIGWPPSTPVAQRAIPAFPAAAIGLKPVFEVVRGPRNQSGITVLSYWLGDLTTGPRHSSNPGAPTSNTWNQCVIVNTGGGPLPPNLMCADNRTRPSGTVGVDQFYHFVLTADEADSVCQAQFNKPAPCGVQAGDFAVLVAMHMTTKENSNWTWQTFWWNYSQPFPYGPPPSDVRAPFNHYAMCTGYSMTVNPPNSPSGTNTLCYNPYLEPAVPDGVHSTCMACHGVASFGNNPNNPGYPPSYTNPNAFISVTVPADDVTYYDCQTTTDFSWFLANLAGSIAAPPPTQPACSTAAPAAR